MCLCRRFSPPLFPAAFPRRFSLAAILLFLGVSTATAQTVTNVSWYHGGESDAAPVNGANVSTAADSGIAALNLNAVGAVTYEATSVAPSANLRFCASTFSYSFPGGSNLLSVNAIATNVTTNFGMEAWVNPTSNATSVDIFLANGRTFVTFGDPGDGGIPVGGFPDTGFGLKIDGASHNYVVWYGDSGVINTGVTATTSIWQQIAVVSQSGSSTFYLNGSPMLTFANAPFYPTTQNFATILGNGYTGGIDEARIFTFTSGTFTPADLNYIPEPGTWSILGSLAVLGFTVLKKRRNRPTA